MSTNIKLVPDKPPEPELNLMAERTARERNLRRAFAEALEYDDWQNAVEMLAAECEQYADEGGKLAGGLWRMRLQALIELSADKELREQ